MTSSSRISSSSLSWIVMWKTSWASSSVLTSRACWHEDYPVWMMVRLFTFSDPTVLTSKIAWRFILEGIELRTSSFSARRLIFSTSGVVFLLLEGYLASSSLSITDCRGGKLVVWLCFLGFDNLLKTELRDADVLSLLKTEVLF
ncbi:hypothetical protein FF1_001410 [Malus domestica]